MLKFENLFLKTPSSSVLETSLDRESPVSPSKNDLCFLDNEKNLESSFYFGKKQPESFYSNYRLRKPTPIPLKNEEVRVTGVTKMLFCKEPLCEYNLDEKMIPDSAGFCVCQQQFCQKHFYSHSCPCPKDDEIIEIFSSTVPSFSPSHLDCPSSTSDHRTCSREDSADKTQYPSPVEIVTITNPLQPNLDASYSPISTPQPPATEQDSPESPLERFRRLRNSSEESNEQQAPTLSRLTPEHAEEDLIAKIQNMQRSIDLIKFMIAQKIKPNFQQTGPNFTTPFIPRPSLELGCDIFNRTKTFSYQEKLNFTLDSLLQEFNRQTKILFDLNKENMGIPRDQEN